MKIVWAVCIALISLGLMTTVHPAGIAGATLIAIEPALEFQGARCGCWSAYGKQDESMTYQASAACSLIDGNATEPEIVSVSFTPFLTASQS